MQSPEHFSESTSKATARIERDLYNRVRKQFHYGLQTMMFQNIFESIDKKIEAGEFNDVIDYIYKNGNLELKPVIED